MMTPKTLKVESEGQQIKKCAFSFLFQVLFDSIRGNVGGQGHTSQGQRSPGSRAKVMWVKVRLKVILACWLTSTSSCFIMCDLESPCQATPKASKTRIFWFFVCDGLIILDDQKAKESLCQATLLTSKTRIFWFSVCDGLIILDDQKAK